MTSGGLTTTTRYESPSASSFLRRTQRQLPAGNTWVYTAYGATETADNPCTTPVEAIPQRGLPRTESGPDPDGLGPGAPLVTTTVYDTIGRVVASTVATERTCVWYDSKGRVSAKRFAAFSGEALRTATYDYAVGGDPLTTRVSDSAGAVTTTVDPLGRTVAYTDVWGKVSTAMEQMVFAEATTVLPLLASDAYHRGHWRDRAKRAFGKMFD